MTLRRETHERSAPCADCGGRNAHAYVIVAGRVVCSKCWLDGPPMRVIAVMCAAETAGLDAEDADAG